MRSFCFFLICIAVSAAIKCRRGGSPRAEIVCHYETELPPSVIDPCKCTLLVISGVIKIDDNNQLVNDVDFKDIRALKKRNPDLKLIVSIGGSEVNLENFTNLTSSVDSVANFTESLSTFVADQSLDGVEIDWRWPGMPGGSVNAKDDLTAFIKAIRGALDDEGHNITKREILPEMEEKTSFSILDLFQEGFLGSQEHYLTPEDPEEGSSLVETSTTAIEFETTEDSEVEENTKGDFSDYLLLDDYTAADEITTTESTTISTSSTTTPTSQSLRSSYRGKIKFKDYFKTSDLKLLSSRANIQTAKGGGRWKLSKKRVLGSATKIIRPLEKRIGSAKILMMTVSPKPEYIVKGYNLKELISFVDIFNIPTHNLTVDTVDRANVTYHHSRLMGVSDIHNADSLLDLIVSMGVPLDRMVLGVPALGSIFTLQNESLTTPRSPAMDQPTWIPYRKVCMTLRDGNWTMERDDDMTGPYSYSNQTWMAFDDPISLRIKSKYVMLRGLAGIGIYNLDEEDWAGTCDQGPYPLLTAVFDTFTQLSRIPRKAVLQSLVRDLETAEQSIRATFVGSSTDLRISPFRIVRVVDKAGEIKAIRSDSETKYECSRQGYYRDPDDCSQFYRCVKFDQTIDDYTVFEYTCPVGLVFDDRWEICAWPSSATPCDGSSEIFPIPVQKNVCTKEGYFTDPENCRWFYACKDYYGNETFTLYEFRCPFGLAYDEEGKICNWPWLVPDCPEYEGGKEIIKSSGEKRGKAIFSGKPKLNLNEKNHYKECVECDDAEITIRGEGILHPEKGIIVAPSYFEQLEKKNALKVTVGDEKYLGNDNRPTNNNQFGGFTQNSGKSVNIDNQEFKVFDVHNIGNGGINPSSLITQINNKKRQRKIEKDTPSTTLSHVALNSGTAAKLSKNNVIKNSHFGNPIQYNTNSKSSENDSGRFPNQRNPTQFSSQDQESNTARPKQSSQFGLITRQPLTSNYNNNDFPSNPRHIEDDSNLSLNQFGQVRNHGQKLSSNFQRNSNSNERTNIQLPTLSSSDYRNQNTASVDPLNSFLPVNKPLGHMEPVFGSYNSDKDIVTGSNLHGFIKNKNSNKAHILEHSNRKQVSQDLTSNNPTNTGLYNSKNTDNNFSGNNNPKQFSRNKESERSIDKQTSHSSSSGFVPKETEKASNKDIGSFGKNLAIKSSQSDSFSDSLSAYINVESTTHGFNSGSSFKSSDDLNYVNNNAKSNPKYGQVGTTVSRPIKSGRNIKTSTNLRPNSNFQSVRQRNEQKFTSSESNTPTFLPNQYSENNQQHFRAHNRAAHENSPSVHRIGAQKTYSDKLFSDSKSLEDDDYNPSNSHFGIRSSITAKPSLVNLEHHGSGALASRNTNRNSKIQSINYGQNAGTAQNKNLNPNAKNYNQEQFSDNYSNPGRQSSNIGGKNDKIFNTENTNTESNSKFKEKSSSPRFGIKNIKNIQNGKVGHNSRESLVGNFNSQNQDAHFRTGNADNNKYGSGSGSGSGSDLNEGNKWSSSHFKTSNKDAEYKNIQESLGGRNTNSETLNSHLTINNARANSPVILQDRHSNSKSISSPYEENLEKSNEYSEQPDGNKNSKSQISHFENKNHNIKPSGILGFNSGQSSTKIPSSHFSVKENTNKYISNTADSNERLNQAKIKSTKNFDHRTVVSSSKNTNFKSSDYNSEVGRLGSKSAGHSELENNSHQTFGINANSFSPSTLNQPTGSISRHPQNSPALSSKGQLHSKQSNSHFEVDNVKSKPSTGNVYNSRSHLPAKSPSPLLSVSDVQVSSGINFNTNSGQKSRVTDSANSSGKSITSHFKIYDGRSNDYYDKVQNLESKSPESSGSKEAVTHFGTHFHNNNNKETTVSSNSEYRKQSSLTKKHGSKISHFNAPTFEKPLESHSSLSNHGAVRSKNVYSKTETIRDGETTSSRDQSHDRSKLTESGINSSKNFFTTSAHNSQSGRLNEEYNDRKITSSNKGVKNPFSVTDHKQSPNIHKESELSNSRPTLGSHKDIINSSPFYNNQNRKHITKIPTDISDSTNSQYNNHFSGGSNSFNQPQVLNDEINLNNENHGKTGDKNPSPGASHFGFSQANSKSHDGSYRKEVTKDSSNYHAPHIATNKKSSSAVHPISSQNHKTSNAHSLSDTHQSKTPYVNPQTNNPTHSHFTSSNNAPHSKGKSSQFKPSLIQGSKSPYSSNSGHHNRENSGKNFNSGSSNFNGFSPRKPVNAGVSLLTKLANRPKFQRFGPGGFRDFDDDLSSEVCERAGLFRHPDSCDKFYECYWDKWINKFTLHVFDCPVTIVYDSGITACNWPFNGPPCHS